MTVTKILLICLLGWIPILSIGISVAIIINAIKYKYK